MNRYLLSLALVSLAGAPIPSGIALAQDAAPTQQLTAQERTALRPVYETYQQRDWTAFAASLPAARSSVQSPYGRYVLGQLQLQKGLQTHDMEAQTAGIDAMLASGVAPPEQIRDLLVQQAALALQADMPNRAETLMTQVVAADPTSPEALAQLAEIKLRLAQDAERGGSQQERAARREEALGLYRQALHAAATAGSNLPESFYRRATALAFDSGSSPLAIAAGQLMVSRYGSPANWRDALLQLRDLSAGDPELSLDIARLMRRAGALAGERDYLEVAEALLAAGHAAEAKAVLDAGIQEGMIAASEDKTRDLLAKAGKGAERQSAAMTTLGAQAQNAATGSDARMLADALLARDQYAEAAEFYRLALQKGGEDPNLINTRLGLALALAGQQAEAEAALKSITGPRQNLAGYLLVWLAQRGG